MVTIIEIGWKSCTRCKKEIPLLEQGSICKSCVSILEKREYKKETKRQYESKKVKK